MTIWDYWRLIAIALTMTVAAFLPLSIGVTGRPRRVWLLLFCIEMFALSCIVAMGSHFGTGAPRWYRTPLVFVGSVAGVIYIGISVRSWTTNRNNEGSHDGRRA